MRKCHRWIGLLASAFLATIAGTGMFMQVHAIWSAYHPVLEPVQLPLPAEEIPVLLEKIIVSALDTTNKADHALSSISISLRMDDGRPRGDIFVSGSASVSQSLSVDPRTGSVVVAKGTLVGKQDEPINWLGVMRNWHDGTVLGAGGRWFGLLCGASLFALGITGLALYTHLFYQRIKGGRSAVLW
jgi:uncharacterized iron-regulated membrane protein